LCEAIELGMTYRHAAQLVGVAYETFLEWRSRGRIEPDTIFGDFLRAIEQAEMKGLAANLENIRAAGKSDWRASLAIIERRYPSDYGKKPMDPVVPEGGSMTVREIVITAPSRPPELPAGSDDDVLDADFIDAEAE
jgi:hypothetical protein